MKWLKKVAMIILAGALCLSLSACGISRSKLQDIASDYGNLVNAEDAKVFQKSYVNYMSIELLAKVSAEAEDLPDARQGQLMVQGEVYDKAKHTYVLWAYRSTDSGYSTDVVVYLTLNEEETKIIDLERKELFTRQFAAGVM